jgi:hypothetical protein
MIFRISVDKRTGFYIAHYDRIYVDVPKETSMLKIFTEAPENTIIPFEYPAYLKKRLHGVLASERKYPTSVEILSNNLSKHKASFRNKYIFDKHNSSRKFEYEKSFPHPNRLNIHNKTRKLSKLHNHKHSKTVKSKIRLNNRFANFL